MAGAKPSRKLIAECSEKGPRGASVNCRVIATGCYPRVDPQRAQRPPTGRAPDP